MQDHFAFEKSIVEIDAWYLENLVCPRDHLELTFLDARLMCGRGHRYPVVEGVPVMLVEEAAETLDVMSASLAVACGGSAKYVPSGNLYLETIGISDEERTRIIRSDGANESTIDPVVNYIVAASNGIMYRHLLGRLPAYPIPELPLPKGEGQHFLDIGCSWGRWCFAAARKGYIPVGLDPSLGAVMAARRVAAQLGVQARFVVGDARRLPFRDKAFPTVFSYSVIQHFSYDDARQAIREVARVLSPKGTSLIQLPNAFGLRSFYNQVRRRFRKPVGFDVRYWTPRQLRNTFESLIGETKLSVDCYFGIGLQAADIYMMPFIKRNLIRASELGKKFSLRLGFLTALSDSIWTKSIRTESLLNS